MSESILNDLCLSLIDSLQKAARGLSNPTANEYHRLAWAKEAYAGAERALSTLISLGPLTTNPDESEPVKSPETSNGKGLTLEEISAWVTKCRRDPYNNKWTRNVDHHDAISVACAALHDLSHQYNGNNRCADAGKKVDHPSGTSEEEFKDVIKVLKRVTESWQGPRKIHENLKKAVELLEVGEVRVEKPVRYTLEMPQGDSREAKVWWVDRNGDNVHLCISVDQLQPISVESRVPGPDDLDERGRCWLRRKYEPDGPTWRLFAPASLFDGALQLYYKEWLPYHALPSSQNPVQKP
jgi:hypothetical protein